MPYKICLGTRHSVCLAVLLIAAVLLPTGASPARAAPRPAVQNGKIAFASSRDGLFEIFTMNADGSLPTRLTSNSDSDQNPAWSPDGAKIAFSTFRDGNEEIYVMNADGSGQTNLTNNSAADTTPSWQPVIVPDPTAPTPSPAVDDVAPSITDLEAKPRCSKTVSSRKPVALTYSLSEDAEVTVSIQRKSRSGALRRCPSGHAVKKAGHFIDVTSLTRSATAGENSADLSISTAGAATKRMLTTGNWKSGTYKAYVTATDAAGNRSQTATVKFWVVKRKRG